VQGPIDCIWRHICIAAIDCVFILVYFLNLFLSPHYLPDKFTESVVVPLVKAKSGNINDSNNYLAIALSNTVSKILESIILHHVNSNSDPDIHVHVYQFGFKTDHPTGLCSQLLKNTVITSALSHF